jgi:phytoene dehydrogenase-like protein
VDHDAIVVGGGHNGLICAAYLARAGLDTLVLEARPSVGGCASTVDALSARVNICNCDHGLFRTTPIADELDLAAHGLRYLDVDPAQVSLPWGGGPAWPLFHDVERTLEAVTLTYPQQVDGYRRYVAAARPVAELVFEVANHPPTPGGVLRRLAGRRGRGVATLLQWSRLSAAAVLRRFFTHDALLAPAVVVGPAVWGLSPDTPGTGLGAITYALKHAAQVGRPVGGSGSLPAAVLAAFETAGGKVRTSSRVAAIRCEGGGVRGVELADGTAIDAPVVVAACDPRTALVQWLRDPPPQAAETVARWRAAPDVDGYESKLDAVVAEPPRYHQTDPQVVRRLGYEPLTATTIVAPGLDAMAAAHRRMGRGQVAERPMFFANVPSVLDLTMRAGTDHVLSLEVLYTPYALTGGWPGSAEPERWLQRFAGLVQPEFLAGVRAWRAMTPDRYESDFHLSRGHATSFAGGPLAALRGRPPELTRYETPVAGLYLTGAATFPGAGVWGAPGRNAATVILRHHGSRVAGVS